MYDVIIIGSGVTGSSIAMNLSKKNGKFLVLEKNEDVCTGTSKANTAIIHAGYDAKPGTMKAKMNVEGSKICEELSKQIGFPYKRIGSFVMAEDEEGRNELKKLLSQGKENGVEGLEILEREDILKIEPNISDDVICALFAKTAAIVDPFLMNIAMAEVAYTNSVDFKFNQEVKNIYKKENFWVIETENNVYETKIVVNAAGLYSDELHNLISNTKYKIKPRRGQYFLLDKDTYGFVKHIVFNVPSQKGKGVVVTPTADGNTLIGPTAVFIDDKDNKETTQEEFDIISSQAKFTMKNITYGSVITSFSGIRAHELGDDFILKEEKDGFFDCVGIESPGLSSSPAIGIYISDLISKKLKLTDNSSFNSKREPIIKTSELSEEEFNELIKKNPKYGQIVCRCERVSEGEIIDAIRRPLGATTLDGIKRRVRATAGRCQGGFCTSRLIKILSNELNLKKEDVRKNSRDSYILVGKVK
ncbi:MAG: NAD(P)/FAD-dependent oxidoreductase [Peptoniphilaceae bacterium]|nr:NAD(P)/FAD-dependent oxidoreductase [Peptoniphilaceae bacterium]MDD7383122.1 NAD(P)/FAD-dependent oxidoreductase [Peptoniphilaceae bacterium]MDY3738368.1 NAD(P)/FAD-dependent oxidoreductase [Peptoniphilaceae bacterium]